MKKYSKTTHINKKEDPSNAPAISVVIPMYNCEVFVPELLSMFSNQSFKDFEVICVIDGATDRTEELVKDYCEKDWRFSYIYKSNGGAGSARNAGIDIARGKYIIFSDADDEYSCDYLKKLYETAIKHDTQIVICRLARYDTTLPNNFQVLGYNTVDFYENIVYSHRGIDNIYVSIQPHIKNRLYDLRFVKENGLRFLETNMAEDTYFGCTGISIAERILFVEDYLLTYRVQINSDPFTDRSVRFLHETVVVLRQLYNWLKDRSLIDTHGYDFFRRVDDVLYVYGAREVTPCFIKDFAHMLNAEEPWDTMTSEEILCFLERSLLLKDDIKKEAEISSRIDTKSLNDKELRSSLLKYRNRIHTSGLIKKVSLETYGRDFNKADSKPFKRIFDEDK